MKIKLMVTTYCRNKPKLTKMYLNLASKFTLNVPKHSLSGKFNYNNRYCAIVMDLF